MTRTRQASREFGAVNIKAMGGVQVETAIHSSDVYLRIDNVMGARASIFLAPAEAAEVAVLLEGAARFQRKVHQYKVKGA